MTRKAPLPFRAEVPSRVAIMESEESRPWTAAKMMEAAAKIFRHEVLIFDESRD